MIKKMISYAVVMMTLLSATIGAYATEPDFLNSLETNYTGEYNVSVSFQSGEEIAALLEELQLSEELSMFADIKGLLESLLSLETKMVVQADMSKDMKKAEISVISASEQEVGVNQNLSIGVKSKTGMWIRMDLAAKTPVFEVIYSYPMLAKYMKIDLFAGLSGQEKEKMLTAFNLIFNKEFMQGFQDFSAELMKKHAEIYMSGKSWIIEFDNDSLCQMADELLPYSVENLISLIDEISEENSVEDSYAEFISQLPSFAGTKLLGENGLRYTCSMSGTRVSSVRMTGDIEIDISQIFTALSGEEWIYESDGLLDFDFEASVKLTKIGMTSVDFPKLTDENSFNASDAVVTTQPEEYIEATPVYPHMYVNEDTDKLYMINGELFVPLRQTIASAYEDCCSIEYDRGKIILASNYFPQFKEILITVGSDKVFADGREFNVGKVFVEDGKAYVSASFFEDVLGWEIINAIYDVFTREYNYTFYTYAY